MAAGVVSLTEMPLGGPFTDHNLVETTWLEAFNSFERLARELLYA